MHIYIVRYINQVNVCVHMCLCIYIYTCISVCTYLYIYICLRHHIYICIYIYICVYVCISNSSKGGFRSSVHSTILDPSGRYNDCEV